MAQKLKYKNIKSNHFKFFKTKAFLKKIRNFKFQNACFTQTQFLSNPVPNLQAVSQPTSNQQELLSVANNEAPSSVQLVPTQNASLSQSQFVNSSGKNLNTVSQPASNPQQRPVSQTSGQKH